MNTLSVQFHDHTLFIVEHNGEPYTPMRPIVDGMGLSWKPQFTKLSENSRRWRVTKMVMRLPDDPRTREVICIPLRKLFGWLCTISPNKVKQELKDRIIQYQNECDDVLYQHWSKQGQASADAYDTLTADMCEIIRRAVNEVVESMPDIDKSVAYASTWRKLNDRFCVVTYKDIEPVHFIDVLDYLESLKPEGSKALPEPVRVALAPETPVTIALPKLDFCTEFRPDRYGNDLLLGPLAKLLTSLQDAEQQEQAVKVEQVRSAISEYTAMVAMLRQYQTSFQQIKGFMIESPRVFV